MKGKRKDPAAGLVRVCGPGTMHEWWVEVKCAGVWVYTNCIDGSKENAQTYTAKVSKENAQTYAAKVRKDIRERDRKERAR